MTKEEAKKFGLHLLQGIMERNESYPIYANNVKQAIDALSETSGSSEIPNDLEEAAIKYQESVPVDTTIHYCGADEDVYFANRIVDAVIFGAKWQKEQNDKDLALTWEDMQLIWQLCDTLNSEQPSLCSSKDFYTKVLNRFNKSK